MESTAEAGMPVLVGLFCPNTRSLLTLMHRVRPGMRIILGVSPACILGLFHLYSRSLLTLVRTSVLSSFVVAMGDNFYFKGVTDANDPLFQVYYSGKRDLLVAKETYYSGKRDNFYVKGVTDANDPLFQVCVCHYNRSLLPL
jgi:hypothetical protein